MRQIRKRGGLFVLAGGLAAMLVGPFLIPVPPLKGTLPPKELADDDSEFIEINGLDIHVKKMGQGEPVFVLLHGFAASLYSWHAVKEPLSQLGTVIAYDRPGFGLSEHPLSWEGQNPYSPEAQVDLLIGLLDHFGVQKAILVGNSAGGTVSMQVSLAHPERVSAMILVDPAVYRGGGALRWLHSLLTTSQMRHLGPLFARQILRHGPELIKLAWHDPTLLAPDMLEFYQKPFQVENWDRALWEFTLASRPTGLTERLGELNLPILVITGDDDRIVPTSNSIRLAGELPNASLEVIANAGHIPHEEQPQAFMEVVTSFLSKIHQKQ
ncbi:MAG: alpha/beta hydrolase [Anaerolineales bacterium]